MKRLLTYEFGTLKLFDNYVFSEISEGVVIPMEAAKILTEIAQKHYQGKPFAYVSNRIYSYAVDPAVYVEASKIENLVGFAIVSSNPTAIKNTQIESMFAKKLFKTFDVLSEAKTWANYIVNQEQKKNKISRKVVANL